MGVPLHSLTNLKHSTNRVVYVPDRAGNHQLYCWQAEGLGPGRKDPFILQISKINYQARQSSTWATALNSDQGEVCFRLHTPSPPPPRQWKQGQRDSKVMSIDFSNSPKTCSLKLWVPKQFLNPLGGMCTTAFTAVWLSGLGRSLAFLCCKGQGYAEFLGTVTAGVGQGCLLPRTQTTSLWGA